jgi:hypothetical protein
VEEAQRAGDVVESGRRVVGGQILRGIDVEIQEVAHDVRVLGAVQAMQSGRRRKWRGGAVELVLERREMRVHDRGLGTTGAGRRHLTRANLADDQLPGLPVPVDVRRVELVDLQLASLIASRFGHHLVVAGGAVLLEEGP